MDSVSYAIKRLNEVSRWAALTGDNVCYTPVTENRVTKINLRSHSQRDHDGPCSLSELGLEYWKFAIH